MALIFISHSSLDNEQTDEFKNTLEQHDIESTFLDIDEKKGIKVGEDWEKKLYNELDKCHVVVLLLSPNWLASKWCFAEYTQARALGKEIIPIVIYNDTNCEIDSWIDSNLQKSDMTKDNNALAKVINRIKEISIKTQNGFNWDIYRSPYPGMMSFEEADAAIFFGREDETRDVIEKLNAMKNKNAPKFLNIVAASGMGKSSFLKAGIIPQLKRSYNDRWLVLPVVRPTERPLYTFSKLIATVLKKEDTYKDIYQSLKEENYEEYLDNIMTEIGFLAPNRAILFPLDQAEELYSLADKEEKEQFFRCLKYFLEEQEYFFTLWTLRADFLKEFQVDKALKNIYKMMEIFPLTSLRKENIVSIIKEPAVVAGIDIDERLIEKIKEDMQTTDALPLLAMGLSELYLKHAKEGRLTLEAYKSLAPEVDNPLEYIVKQKAEEAICEYKDNASIMEALKTAFIPYMVRVNSKNEYIKIAAVWNKLPMQAHEVLENLVKARLLIKRTVDEKEIVEITHEALMRKWPLLQTWLQEEHEFLVGKSQLEIALAEYNKEDIQKYKRKALLTGLRLQKVSGWLVKYPKQLTADEKAYIKESVEIEKKQSNRKKIFYISVLVLVLLFGIFSTWQSAESQKLFQKAKEQRMKSEKYKIFLEKLTIDNYDKNSALRLIKLFINKSKVLSRSEKNALYSKFKSENTSYQDKRKYLELLISEKTKIRGTIFDINHNPLNIGFLCGYQKMIGLGAVGLQKSYDSFLESGVSLVTNIDIRLQNKIEDSIDKVQNDLKSDEIIVGIMESKTGNIISLTTTKRYNPYSIKQKDVNAIASKFIEYPYEPGSVFKPFILAIALDRNKTTPKTWFDIGSGKLIISKKYSIGDDYPSVALTATDIIVHSSNIGITKIAWRLTGEELKKGLLKFGFERKTGIDLPRELHGKLKSKKLLNNKLHRANASYGYGSLVTFMQLLKAYSAFNNNGLSMTPHLMNHLEDFSHRPLKVPKVTDHIKAIDKNTANQMHDVLLEVVKRGSGKNAKYPGIEIGGKTGTAHIAKNGRYTNEYHSSFYGFANDRRGNKYTIGVLVIRAKGKYKYFASQSAAPIFKKVVESMVQTRFLILDFNKSKVSIKQIRNDKDNISLKVLEERFKEALKDLKPI